LHSIRAAETLQTLTATERFGVSHPDQVNDFGFAGTSPPGRTSGRTFLR
jgi:hypothetical protein